MATQCIKRGQAMKTATQTLFDDVFAIFRRACEEQQYGVAEHLLGALEQLAGGDDLLLDDVYLSFALPGSAGSASPEPPLPRAG